MKQASLVWFDRNVTHTTERVCLIEAQTVRTNSAVGVERVVTWLFVIPVQMRSVQVVYGVTLVESRSITSVKWVSPLIHVLFVTDICFYIHVPCACDLMFM